LPVAGLSGLPPIEQKTLDGWGTELLGYSNHGTAIIACASLKKQALRNFRIQQFGEAGIVDHALKVVVYAGL
jgi:serine protease inhibitor ecotin